MNQRRWKGIVCSSTCLFLPLAILPQMNEDGEIVTIASWYGPGFHGRKTASGERFNQNALTAASRTLPFGTRVKVRNLKNGKTCTVKINDRGPFVKGRGIDLSHEAARRLGIDGIAKVCYSTVPNYESKRDVDKDETPKAPGADGALEVAVATGVTESIEKPLAMAVAPPHAKVEALNEPPNHEQPRHLLEEQPEPFRTQIDLLRAQLKPQTKVAVKKAAVRKQVSRTVAYSRVSKKHARSRRSPYIAHRRYKSKFGKSVDRLTARASHIYRGLKGIFAML